MLGGVVQNGWSHGLLTLAPSEAGLENREPCDLAQTTEHVLHTPRSEIERLKLTINTTLHPAAVEGNPRLLERLVSNLVENAIHHNTPGGDVEITTGARAEETAADTRRRGR